jgi:hypothetical protein
MYVIVSKSHPGQRSRFEVLGQNIEVTYHLQYEAPTLGVLQIDTEGSLCEIVPQISGSHRLAINVSQRRTGCSTSFPGEGFNLHNVRT